MFNIKNILKFYRVILILFPWTETLAIQKIKVNASLNILRALCVTITGTFRTIFVQCCCVWMCQVQGMYWPLGPKTECCHQMRKENSLGQGWQRRNMKYSELTRRVNIHFLSIIQIVALIYSRLAPTLGLWTVMKNDCQYNWVNSVILRSDVQG